MTTLTREIKISKSQLKKMTELEMCNLMTIEELKLSIVSNFNNYDFPQKALDFLLESLELKMPENDFIQFCDSLGLLTLKLSIAI